MTFLYCWSWMTFPPSFRWKTTVRTLFFQPETNRRKLRGPSFRSATPPCTSLPGIFFSFFFKWIKVNDCWNPDTTRGALITYWAFLSYMKSIFFWNENLLLPRQKKILVRSYRVARRLLLSSAQLVMLSCCCCFFSSSPCRNKHKEAYHLSRWRSKTDNFFPLFLFSFDNKRERESLPRSPVRKQ